MRVIAGQFRGRKLLGPKTNLVRPTPDRVREALFNIMGEVEDACILDLFCGTGAVAIEALSRGAARVVLVDRNTSLAKKNLASLGLQSEAKVYQCDFRQGLGRIDGSFDFIFADPPYDMAEEALPALLDFAAKRLAPEGEFIFEHPKRTELVNEAHAMQRSQTRLYGDTALSFYVHQ